MHRYIYWAAVYGMVATVLTILHCVHIDLPYHPQQAAEHHKILEGQQDRPYNIRVFQPLAVEALHQLVPSLRYARVFIAGYAAIRWLSILATLIAFEIWLRKFTSLATARLVVLFVTVIYPMGYFFYNYQPTSVVDLACFTVALSLIAHGWHWPLVPLMALATLNRNTAIFILPAYVLWHLPSLWTWPPRATRVLMVSVALAGVWGALIFLLERLYPGGAWVHTPDHYIWYNLHSKRVWVLCAAMLFPLIISVPTAWRSVPGQVKLLSLITVPYLALHVVMAQCDEVRYWLNLYVLLGPFLAAAYDRLAQTETPSPAPADSYSPRQV